MGLQKYCKELKRFKKNGISFGSFMGVRWFVSKAVIIIAIIIMLFQQNEVALLTALVLLGYLVGVMGANVRSYLVAKANWKVEAEVIDWNKVEDCISGINPIEKCYQDSRTDINYLPYGLYSYLPTSKHDLQSIERLKKLKPDEILALLPHLLGWIQDSNWPISRVMTPFLASLGECIIPEIRWVLEGKDDIWKSNCIAMLQKMPFETAMQLKPLLERIANNSSESEVIEETNEAAKECLKRIESELERN